MTSSVLFFSSFNDDDGSSFHLYALSTHCALNIFELFLYSRRDGAHNVLVTPLSSIAVRNVKNLEYREFNLGVLLQTLIGIVLRV